MLMDGTTLSDAAHISFDRKLTWHVSAEDRIVEIGVKRLGADRNGRRCPERVRVSVPIPWHFTRCDRHMRHRLNGDLPRAPDPGSETRPFVAFHLGLQ
jgi:hypothetical protein